MKKRDFVLLGFLLILSGCSAVNNPIVPTPAAAQESTNPGSNMYFGETPPGAEPVRFAEEFLPGRYHSAPTFAPDGMQVWWAGDYSAATIYTSQLVDGIWSEPAIVKFSEEINSYRDPFISPDGKRFYFLSASTIPGESDAGKENIWMMEKEAEGWGDPVPLPDGINQYTLHWTVSVADNYNLYFSAEHDKNPDIYVSHFVNGEYQEAQPLGVGVNSAGLEFTPNIAPDESYLLFTRLPDRSSSAYLYISYATANGWSEAQRVENIPYCMSPIVTPDRKYVIFMGGPDSIWWRDTSFVEELQVE